MKAKEYSFNTASVLIQLYLKSLKGNGKCFNTASVLIQQELKKEQIFI